MLNVSYFDVGKRGVAQARKDRSFGCNTIPYRPDSRDNTERRYQNGLKNGASAVSEKTLLGESNNLGNVSAVTQPVMSIAEETPPMRRLMFIIDVKDKDIKYVHGGGRRAIKLADRKYMFYNALMNAASAYAVRDRDNKLPGNVETTVFAPQGFVPEIPPIVPPVIDVRKIVDDNKGVLANNVNLAMEQGAVPIIPINGQKEGSFSRKDIESSIAKALAEIVQGTSNVVSPSEVSSVVNGGSVQSNPTNVIIFDADGSECYFRQEPGKEAERTIIYPDKREPTNVLIYGADGGEYYYQQEPGKEAERTIIYPDNREPTNVIIYGEDGGVYHYQQEPGKEAERTIIYPDNREKEVEEVPLKVTLDPKKADGEALYYQQTSDESGLYDNIRGGIVAPERDEGAVSDNVLDNTNNSIIEQLKEKAERLRRANEDRTSSLNNLIDTRSQKQQEVDAARQALDATKKEVIERYQSLVVILEDEGVAIDNQRRDLEKDLASLDEKQVATKNAIASYERELEELNSLDVKRR